MPASILSCMATVVHLFWARPLTSQPSPDNAHSHNGHASAHNGSFMSSTWGWRLRFDPGVWKALHSSTGDHLETLVLETVMEGSGNTRVTFRTFPRGHDTLRAHLQEAAEALTKDMPGATVNPAVDADGYIIFQKAGEFRWIGSYIVTSQSGDDSIVELDTVAVSGNDAVLVVSAAIPPSVYTTMFIRVDELRQGISENSIDLIVAGDTESGGSRPMVQF